MTKTISVWNQQAILAANLPIQPSVPLIALNSGDLSNDSGTIYNSIIARIEYSNLIPDPGGAPPFQIGCTIQSKDQITGLWFDLGYQFNPFYSSSQAKKRIIIVQPDMDTSNLGIDDVIFPLNREEARISREQGLLKEGKFRVLINLIDNDPLGPLAFTSVKVSCEVELYNV